MCVTTMQILLLLTCAIAFARGAGVSPNIVGGSDAKPSQFPYQAAIFFQNRFNSNYEYQCGASIIAPNLLLTAAYCFSGNRVVARIGVRVGSINLNGPMDNHVKMIIRHPNYNPEFSINDIAIVVLYSKLKYTTFIHPVQLATSDPNNGTVLTASGWGYTNARNEYSDILQYVHLAALDLNTCGIRYLCKTHSAIIATINTGFVCTIAPINQGTCIGDYGGPLVNENGEQVGIVSWGLPCTSGLPGVYTSVAVYRSWITETIRTNKI